MPFSLQSVLDNVERAYDLKQLQAATRRVQKKYEAAASLLSGEIEHLAYLFYRVPATYSATVAALLHMKRALPDFVPHSQVDLGAGPGTGMLAVANMYGSVSGIGLERSDEFLQLFYSLKKHLPEQASSLLCMHKFDLSTVGVTGSFDLLTSSYSCGEWTATTREGWLRWAKQHARVVCITEPGTPAGWQCVLECRKILMEAGARIVAPCPHTGKCPFLDTEDWCHLSVRVQRSSLHRRLKGGSLAYEDEKFCYLIAVCDDHMEVNIPAARIVHTPCHRSGHTHLTLCTKEGLQNVVISKKHKQVYQQARRSHWGDAFPICKASL